MATLYRVTTLSTGTYVVGGGITRTYFESTGGTPTQAVAAMAAFWNGVKDVIHTSCTLAVGGQVEELNDADGQITGVTGVATTNIAGTDSGQPNAPQLQGVVQLRTGAFSDGREMRGRIYIPSLGQSSVGGGGWNAGKLTTMNAAAAALVASANAQLVIWQRPREAGSGKNHDLPQRDGSWQSVTSASVWAKTGVLRSRRD